MAVAYVNKGTFASGNGGITPGIPTGYTVGNLLVLLVESANETITAPSGWNEYAQQGTGPAGSAGGVRLGIFWRIATAGQAAPAIADTGNHTTAIIAEFSGIEPGSPFANSSYSTPATATFYFNNLACVYSQPFILLALANDRDVAGTTNLSNWSTGLTSFTQHHDQTVSTQAGGGIALATGIANVTAGNYIGQSGVTNASAVSVIAYTIELRPKIPLAGTVSTGTSHTADLQKLGLRSSVCSGSVPYFGVKYGCIYNWYAVNDSRMLAPSGWHVASKNDFATLLVYLDPDASFQNNIASPAMTEPGMYWQEGENIATNTAKFNARGLFGRGQYGFNALGGSAYWWNSEQWDTTYACFTAIIRNDPELITAAFGLNNTNPKWNGYGVRLVKDSTSLSHGQSGFMTGNDLKIYRTICIGTQEWLADNLCESKFRNGETIPGGTMPNATWYGLTTAGMCFPDDEPANAYGGYLPTPYVLGGLKGTGALTLNISSGQPRLPAIKYGFLYNWYAVVDSRNIASSGWSAPTLAQLEDIWKYYSPAGNNGDNAAGNAMKETGTTYWMAANGTNTSKLNCRGAGSRTTLFYDTKYSVNFWSTTQYNSTKATAGGLTHLSNVFSTNGIPDKTTGLSVRLRKDSTTLQHGEEGRYVGNDGVAYKTVCIGTTEWLAENLIETRYRNGDYIDNVTDQTTWNNLSIGAYCAYDNDPSNAFTTSSGDSAQGLLKAKGKLLTAITTGTLLLTRGFGFLYNYYVIKNTANIANTGWSVPIRSVWEELATYLGGATVAGGKLKETGLVSWWSPNTGATNEVGFNLRGASYRDPFSGNFGLLTSESYLWTATEYMGIHGTAMSTAYNDTNFRWSGGGTYYRQGCSIRLVKDSTTLQEGETGTYTGNDGKIYATICINGKEFLSQNLAETKYRDGSSIPEVTQAGNWTTLTTHAFCAPGNNWTNALYGGWISGVTGTLEFSGQAASLVATILTYSGIQVTLTGKGKLLANTDGSTTLLAQIKGGAFIPVITFF